MPKASKRAVTNKVINMKCENCKQPINSRNDLIISYWRHINIPILALYHKKCFREVNSKVPGFITPSIIDANKLKSILAINYIVLFIFLIMVIYSIYTLKGIKNWNSFLNIGIMGYLFSIFLIIVLGLTFYLPIRNLKIIKDVKNLK